MNTSIATQLSSSDGTAAARWVLHSHHFHAALLRALYEAPGIDAASLLSRSLATVGRGLTPSVSVRGSAEATLREVFLACGLGLLDPVGIRPDGTGLVALDGSHSAQAWTERFARAKRPVCGIASGVLTGLLEDLFAVAVEVREVECAAMGAERCRFEISPAPVGGREERRSGRDPVDGLYSGSTMPLQDAVLEAGPGAPYVALPAGFYASISHLFEAEVPRLRGSKFASLPGILLLEAAHRNGFHLFGEALAADEIGKRVGSETAEGERLESLFGLVRGLGWGEWRIHSFLPGERLIIRIAGSYEATAHLQLWGRDTRTRCTVALGAAAAVMNLLYRAPEGPLPTLTPSLYNALFRNPHTFRASETRCVACGDDFCELVVNPLTA